MYMLPHKPPRIALLHHNNVSLHLIFRRKLFHLQQANSIHSTPSRPPFSSLSATLMLISPESCVPRTPRATSRVPQHISLTMTSENVILITFDLILFLFSSALVLFSLQIANYKILFFHKSAQIFYFWKYKFIYGILFPLLRSKSALLLRACSTNIRI